MGASMLTYWQFCVPGDMERQVSKQAKASQEMAERLKHSDDALQQLLRASAPWPVAPIGDIDSTIREQILAGDLRKAKRNLMLQAEQLRAEKARAQGTDQTVIRARLSMLYVFLSELAMREWATDDALMYARMAYDSDRASLAATERYVQALGLAGYENLATGVVKSAEANSGLPTDWERAWLKFTRSLPSLQKIIVRAFLDRQALNRSKQFDFVVGGIDEVSQSSETPDFQRVTADLDAADFALGKVAQDQEIVEKLRAIIQQLREFEGAFLRVNTGDVRGLFAQYVIYRELAVAYWLSNDVAHYDTFMAKSEDALKRADSVSPWYKVIAMAFASKIDMMGPPLAYETSRRVLVQAAMTIEPGNIPSSLLIADRPEEMIAVLRSNAYSDLGLALMIQGPQSLSRN